MPVSDLQRTIAEIALGAAARHGFALGGGVSLIAHGIVSRPTQDVDLFTDREGAVAPAAAAVETALRTAVSRSSGWTGSVISLRSGKA